MNTSPVSEFSHAVAADVTGMLFSVVYCSLNALTSQDSPVKLLAVKFEPKHVVSAWLSISDCAILFGVVCWWLICLWFEADEIFLWPDCIPQISL
jgi:hypothetical protein